MEYLIWATIVFIMWNAIAMLVIHNKSLSDDDKEDPIHYKWDRE